MKHRRRRISTGPNRKPWRRVLPDPEPGLHEGRGGLLGPDTTRRTRWWELTLDCGHVVEKIVRYRPQTEEERRGWNRARSLDDVLDPPKRVRCDYCPPDPMLDQETP